MLTQKLRNPSAPLFLQGKKVPLEITRPWKQNTPRAKEHSDDLEKNLEPLH